MFHRFTHKHNNEQGLTLIELLIATVISVVVLGATISTYTKQERVLRTEGDKTYLRGLGRLAMEELAKEIRQAGYGFPPGQGIFAATETSITYFANTDDTQTMVAADVTAGDTTLTVRDDSGFNDTDNLVIFNLRNITVWEVGQVSGTPAGNVITLNSGTANSYQADQNIVIHKYHTITYTFNTGNNLISETIDGEGAIPLIGKVSDMTLTYFDANDAVLATPMNAGDANLANIRKVEIELSLEESTNTSATATFKTNINLRNMG
ncbi:MAG: hypothetical protein E2O45_04215 [Nitrospina sp.]|nr:MAG: hypothetical protein E2O45_04215 [Nitrospina sp.]